MTKPRQTIAIVGAGIGGLTAALAFAQRGAKVIIFEAATELKEVGAGLQITPNGMRVLEALGLSDACAAQSIAADAAVPMDAISGMRIARFDLRDQTPRYRFFHRAALQSVLSQAAVAAGVDLRLKSPVLSVDLDGTISTERDTFKADVVVGADGIHSVTRNLFKGQPATFSGQVAWRGVVRADGLDPVANIWMAPGRHVVTYPLRNGAMNIVAVQERAEWAEEGWDHFADPLDMREAFRDCAPALQEILAKLDGPRLWGLFRHPVGAVWGRGKVALLGDAVHPTLPFLAQGANLAIEDAYVLARCWDEHASFASACKRYQQLRRDRVVRAIATANRNAANYHLSGVRRGIAFAGLRAIGRFAPDRFINRLSWLYDHDVTR